MEELYLNVGAHIQFRDGSGGTLHRVVVEPRTRQITDLVILKGILQKQDRVIPVSLVERADPERIQLALSTQELENYPEYREIEFEEMLDDWESQLVYPREHVLYWYPPTGMYEIQKAVLPMVRRKATTGIPETESVIGRSTVVRNVHGVVGKVDHVWVDRKSWEITHLVVRRGLIPHCVLVPYSWIELLTPEEIFIRGTNEQLIEVPVSQLHREPETEAAFQPVRETSPLDHNLTVAAEVIEALDADPRTASSIIEAIYDQGVLTLTGDVEKMEIHAAAEEIARRHEHVVSVVNALEVSTKSAAVSLVEEEIRMGIPGGIPLHE